MFRRVAWFHVTIECDDEEVANVWLATVNQALDNFAQQAATITSDKVKIIGPMEAGQSIPVREAHDPNV